MLPRERNWYNSQQRAETLYPDKLIYKTTSGLVVRSKSERMIAELLDEYGIVYFYEPQIIVNGKMMFPDFAIYKSSGEIVLWEHFGLLENEDYRQRALSKIMEYSRAGVHMHTNLICTSENDVLSAKAIRRIIEERLL